MVCFKGFNEMDAFKFKEINVVFTDTSKNTRDREITMKAEHKCATCGSTNLIRITDYSKAILFLGYTVDNSEPDKKRSLHRGGKDDYFDKKWCCLDCKHVW
jgi:hypothetical protein